MDILYNIFSGFGLSASAGLNAYIPLLLVALTAKFTDFITLKPPWDALESWWIIGLLILLSVIEFFADKFPAVNHINDLIQTFVRPTAGAILFAASTDVITQIQPVFALGLGLLVAGSVHLFKSAIVRPMVTATTAGAGNTPISVAEDIISLVVSFISIILPILLIFALVITIVLLGLRRSSRGKAVT